MIVTLREWDWEAQNFTEVEYDWALLKAFIDDLRLGNRWREDPEIVFRRFLRLEEQLTDYRNAQTLTVPIEDLAPDYAESESYASGVTTVAD